MDEIKYIVAPNKAITTRVGVKGPGKEITPKIIGPNFNALITKGLIIKEEDLIFKNDVEKSEMNLAKPERVIEKAKSEEPEKEAEKDINDLTKKEIKAALKGNGIEFNDRANKTDLIKLLESKKEEILKKETPKFGAQKQENQETE